MQLNKNSTTDVPLESGESSQEEETILVAEIKEEPIDYDDASVGEEEDDDDDDDDEIYNHYDGADDDNSDYEDGLINFKSTFSETEHKSLDSDNIPADVRNEYVYMYIFLLISFSMNI